jgi:hypothetical protein
LKIAGSASGSESGSICQRHGSADPDPDPHQNGMDPQHCRKHLYFQLNVKRGNSESCRCGDFAAILMFATFFASAFDVNEPLTVPSLGPIFVDLDPHGTALIWLSLIRIQIRTVLGMRIRTRSMEIDQNSRPRHVCLGVL